VSIDLMGNSDIRTRHSKFISSCHSERRGAEWRISLSTFSGE